jgi:myo-inositol-1(or 4)-monophosphatase
MTATDPLAQARDVAIGIARDAGKVLLEGWGTRPAIDFKSEDINLVTEYDKRSEALIVARLAAAFPDDRVVAEEGTTHGEASGAARVWYVDPLDGTTNFAHGLPLYCSTIALEVDGELRVGAVYDPTRDELFTAIRGGGAFLNGGRIRVSTAATLIDSLLVTGFPYSVQEKLDEMLGLFGRFLSKARAVRRLGSAALDMCYVAAGRLDGFWEEGLNAWDIAGGVLIVQEAGGRITSLDGGPFVLRSGRIIASNGLLHDEMRAVIADYHASRK